MSRKQLNPAPKVRKNLIYPHCMGIVDKVGRRALLLFGWNCPLHGRYFIYLLDVKRSSRLGLVPDGLRRAFSCYYKGWWSGSI